jgi:hypothetical protein
VVVAAVAMGATAGLASLAAASTHFRHVTGYRPRAPERQGPVRAPVPPLVAVEGGGGSTSAPPPPPAAAPAVTVQQPVVVSGGS